MIILRNWSVTSNQTGFRAPEVVHSYLQGEAFGHPDFEDGTHVRTSPIRKITIADEDGCNVVRTATGSLYAVYPQDVDPEYEKEFPGAFDSLCVKG